MSESTAKKLDYQNVWDVWNDAGLNISFFRGLGFSNMPNYLVGMMRDLGIYHSDLLLVSSVMNLCKMGGGPDTIISNASLGMSSKDGGRQKRRMQRLGYLRIKVVKKLNASTGRFETWGVQYDFSGFFKRVNEILIERGRIHSDQNIVANDRVDNEFLRSDLLKIKNAVFAIFYAEQLTRDELNYNFDAIISILEKENSEMLKLFSLWINNMFGKISEELVENIKNITEVKQMLSTTIDKWGSEIKLEGKRERNVEIAHSMKRDGLPTEQIIKYSGLSYEEIEKL